MIAELFSMFLIFALVTCAIVITLTLTVILLLKHIRDLEDDLEANLPPF